MRLILQALVYLTINVTISLKLLSLPLKKIKHKLLLLVDWTKKLIIFETFFPEACLWNCQMSVMEFNRSHPDLGREEKLTESFIFPLLNLLRCDKEL